MNKAYLRKWSHTMGIVLALFLFVQAATGALMPLESTLNFSEPTWVLSTLHRKGGFFGDLYRILLGLATMGMATSGTLIYLKIRARTKK